MKLKTLSQIQLKNKLILLRIDINSPVVKGKILDNPRFEASASTIKYLIKNKAKIAIIAHQGRKGDSDFLSLKQHAKILSKYINKKINYIDDLFGKTAASKINSLKQGQAILLKNVRSFEDEKDITSKNNHYKKFCSQFNFYINEAFSVSHRAQGSIILPPKYLPSAIGLEFQKEFNALTKFKSSKAKARIFILGGAKIEDYFPLFKFLKSKQNKLLAAGVLANLFLTAEGIDLGYETKWIKSHNYLPLLPKLKKLYAKYKSQIILPIDLGLLIGKGKRKDVYLEDAPFKYKIYDVGNETTRMFKKYLDKADYIFMKGPLGFSEIKQFSKPTREILSYISNLTKKKRIFSIIGGGHLTTAIKEYHLSSTFSHISFSGGALIAFISGEKLPGIVALEKSK